MLMTELALEFAKVVGFEEPIYQLGYMMESEISSKGFSPNNTDDILALTEAWLEKVLPEVNGISINRSATTRIWFVKLYRHYDYRTLGQSESLPTAIMQAVVNAAEKLEEV